MNQDEKKIIINCDDLSTIKEQLLDLHPFDIANLFSELDEDKQKQLLSIYDNDALAEILSYVEPEQIDDVLKVLSKERLASIINKMEADDAQPLLNQMNEESKQKIINLLSKDAKEDLEKINNYTPDTAGTIMNPNFVKILSQTTLKQAIKELTAMAPDVETINKIFIVDGDDHLLGTIDLKELICARMPKVVDDIMHTNYQSVNVDDDFSVVVSIVKNYDTIALPVLENNKLVGIITMDDAFDALTKESEEDYAKLAGLTEDEDKKETIFGSFKKRIPWLITLLVLDILIAIVISRFDEIIEKVTILTFFQASVLGLSGNCGTQGLAVSVRKISLGKLNNFKEISKYLIKELFQGLALGLILGVISLLLVTGMLYLLKENSIKPIEMGYILGIAVSISVTLSNFIGVLLPIIFYKIHIDPAVASGPFITTVNDVVAILVYFGISLLILSNYL